MVYSGDTREGGVRDFVMAIGPERSKPPLHNFNFPCLKWGNQRHLRCMKLSDSASVKDTNNGASADRIRSSRSPPARFVAATRDYELRRFKKFKSMINDNRAGGGGGDDVEEGIEAFSEKLMCDLKADADKFQARIFRKEVADERRTTHHHHRRQWEEEEYNKKGKSKSKSKSPPLPQSASAVVETGGEARPWNLRTRRASCKSPVAGNSVNGKGLRIEERGVSNSSSPLRSHGGAKSPPRVLRGEKRDKEEAKDKETEPARPKFAVALSRKEIDEDFMAMLGHRPARRPKKRPRNVQRQLDMLFPGLWLSEVTVDTYKVPELPENGKR